MAEFNLSCLIQAVKSQPLIWDRAHPHYKDRNKTKTAWAEICKTMNPDYDNLDPKLQNEYGNSVMKKWANLRDSYHRGEKKSRTYIYSKQLDFLKKHRYILPNPIVTTNDIRYVINSVNSQHFIIEDTTQQTQPPETVETQVQPTEHKPTVIGADREHHLWFFKGVLPMLTDLSEDDTLEFQLKVLRAICDVRKRKDVREGIYTDQSTSQDDQVNSNTDNPTTSTNEETPSSAPKRRKFQNDVEPLPSTQVTDEFSTFGQHVASQLRNLPIVNAIVSQNYINTYLAEERLKVIKGGSQETSTSDGFLNCHDEDEAENSQEEDYPDLVKIEVVEGDVQ